MDGLAEEEVVHDAHSDEEDVVDGLAEEEVVHEPHSDEEEALVVGVICAELVDQVPQVDSWEVLGVVVTEELEVQLPHSLLEVSAGFVDVVRVLEGLLEELVVQESHPEDD